MRAFTIGFLLLASTLAVAQAPRRPVTMKDFLELRVASDLQFSPDGQKIVFVVSENDLQKSSTPTNLWLAGIADTAARPLTRYREKVSTPRWSPDGKYIAFIDKGRTAGEGEGKDDETKPQIWLLPGAGGEASRLTETKHGIVSYDWSPDGRRIVYLAEQEEQAELAQIRKQQRERKFDAAEVDKQRRIRQLWSLDVAGGGPTKLLDGDLGIDDIRVSPDGKHVLYRTNYTGKVDDARKFDYWLYSFADGKARRLTNRPGEESAARWSPDASSILCIAPFDPLYTYSRLDLFRLNIDRGVLEPLGNSLDRSVTSAEWSADGKSVYFVVASGVREVLYSLPTASPGASPRRLLSDNSLYASLAVAAIGSAVAMTGCDGTHPPEIYWRSLKTGALRQLSRLNTQVEQWALSPEELVTWPSVDGTVIEGILVKPPGVRPAAGWPMITIPHGGPFWRNRLALQELDEPQVYAASGYAVFLPNFRGSDGYGHAFGVANFRDLGFGDFYDLMTGIDYLIAQGVADRERLGIVGGSYGGYMTNWAISHTNRFKAAVSRYGIFSLVTDFSNSEYPSWEPDYLGDFYWNDPAAYARHAPATDVDRIQTPVLIQHGQEDPNTFISNSKEMYTALKMLGRTVEFVTYPREGHGFHEPNHILDVVQRTTEWFDRFLKNVGYDRDASYKIGDAVPGARADLTVLSVARQAEYEGQTPKGDFLEVTVRLIGKGATQKLTLALPADLTLIDRNGKAYAALGSPVVAAERKTLARGGLSFSAEKSKAQSPAVSTVSLTVAAVFEVPSATAGLKLKAMDFPLVAIE